MELDRYSFIINEDNDTKSIEEKRVKAKGPVFLVCLIGNVSIFGSQV